ncbi:Tricarboxylate/iron carrier [Pavlovales sp. CCMP2436]|nr:Tricarboxylate/iron carrier [Pavlovales sp. CCMP2436]
MAKPKPAPGVGGEGYTDRVRHLFSVWDPTLLIVQRQAIERARLVVERAAGGGAPTRSAARDMERAGQIVADAIHPVTGDVLPNFVRRSSTVPVNAVIAAAMLSTSSVSGTAMLHLYFQSYNSLVRYANHSDERHPLDPKRLWAAYGLATGAAVAIGVGAGRALHDAPPALRPLRMIVPHLAVACAGALGLYMHNAPDAVDGIELVDSTGTVRGVSVEAGRGTLARALALHAVVLPSCQLLLPPLLMRYGITPSLQSFSGLTRLSLAFPLALGTTFACVAGLAPLAAAAFPRQVSFEPSALEPQFHGLADAEGRPLGVLYSHKALY